MKSEKLQKAWEYEKKKEQEIEDRPAFHLSPRTGWMNDPNGFTYYNGAYHMFYQYYPYNASWGPMHWGHAVSGDLLHWEYKPAALAPDETYDHKGCFSGSAVELDDGRQLLMYTGVSKEDADAPEVQMQCLAVGDGTFYTKYEANPVITGADVPDGGSKVDFRDPKMWREEDGTFYCVIGNRAGDGSGQILHYQSEDGFHWNYKQILAKNNNRFGKMWECPDFFELDGKWVLLTSPQDALAKGLEYAEGNITLYMTGEWNKNDSFIEETNQTIDYGIDFYAPQTTLAPDGRRIMIGWMQNWDTCAIRKEKDNWFGQMSLPRELQIRDGKLLQKPVRELKALCCNTVTYENVSFSGTKKIDQISGRKIDLELEAELAEDAGKKFSIQFAKDDTFYTELTYDAAEQILGLNRKYSGTRRAGLHERHCAVQTKNNRLKLRMILDQYSVEVFVNDGEQVMSMTFYTRLEADDIVFHSEGRVNMNIVKSDLRI